MEEHKELIKEINDLEKKYVDILRQTGVYMKYSFIGYEPTSSTIPPGPQPKYIPKKIAKPEEPPIVYGPAARFRPNREDCRHRTKRQLDLICSIIDLEGETPERIVKKEILRKELNLQRAEYRKRRRLNKKKK